MIIVKSLRWSNWFSYGEDNYINLEETPLMQIAGINGSGKSSIPLIIEEVLYGKNHIGKKKQTLVNRYLDNPLLTAELIFSKDNVEYKIKISRKSTIKIQFLKGKEDLSSHTATNTYKAIQDVLGIDFKVFVQLIYQSSKINLEFLEATDTNRKKFLISLFKLDKYLEIHNVFKKAESKVNTQLATLHGNLATIEKWIDNYINKKLVILEKKEIVAVNKEDIDKLVKYKSELLNIKETNSKINKNNQYKELLSNLDLSVLSYDEVLPKDKQDNLAKRKKYQHKVTEYKTKINGHSSVLTKLNMLTAECPACFQQINSDIKESMIKDKESSIKELKDLSNKASTIISDIESMLTNYAIIEDKIAKKDKVSDEFSKLQIMISKDTPSETIVAEDIIKDINILENEIESVSNNIKKISEYNSKVEGNNTKVQVIKEQLVDYKKQAEDVREEVFNIEEQQGKLNILKKAFSTNGLLNYKLEYLIKDLEEQINNYLQELSSGKFQIVFVLQEEKLNIEILDEGISVTIAELSAGELARINAATLLAIRKLMAAISSTNLNILFLDEILGVLDDNGKEKLIEVLHAEKGLNTFLVSHEYSHPLIPKINVIKEGKISRLENG